MLTWLGDRVTEKPCSVKPLHNALRCSVKGLTCPNNRRPHASNSTSFYMHVGKDRVTATLRCQDEDCGGFTTIVEPDLMGIIFPERLNSRFPI